MRQLIVGNWKMNGLGSDLGEIDAIATSVASQPPGADIVVCVPATLVSRAAIVAAGRIAIGGECCHPKIDGPHTGEISSEMLVDAGAASVILGHSERRAANGETDAYVAATAEAAARAGLDAIICIGETAEQHADGTEPERRPRLTKSPICTRSSEAACSLTSAPKVRTCVFSTAARSMQTTRTQFWRWSTFAAPWSVAQACAQSISRPSSAARR